MPKSPRARGRESSFRKLAYHQGREQVRMSDLGFNKIAGCVLATGLALIGLNEASHAFFPHTEHAKDGYHIDVPEVSTAPGEVKVAEGPRDYFKLVSAGNVEAGKAVAVKCLQCHKLEQGGGTLTGPELYGIVGRKMAVEAGFKYSTGPGSLTEKAAEAPGVWDYDHLDRFLEAPKKYAPGTAMGFIGLKKQQDRSDILAYLRTLTSGEPLALPAPLPEQPAAPAEGAVPAEGAAPTEGAAPAPVGAAPAPAGATPAPAGAAAPAKPATPAPAQPAQH